jgi:hypothetical protein
MRGGDKTEKTTPAINAKSKEEESFVKYDTPVTEDISLASQSPR